MKKGAKQGLRDLRQPVVKEPPKITFPCDYPLKVVGDAADDFPATVCQVIVRHAPDFDETTLEVMDIAMVVSIRSSHHRGHRGAAVEPTVQRAEGHWPRAHGGKP